VRGRAAGAGGGSAGHEPMVCSPEDGCSLCGDVAVPMRVVALRPESGTALAEVLGIGVSGGRRSRIAVALDLVDGVELGDVVLVHQGFAIERVPEP
jgi:hydrogenase maturation factor